VLTPPGYGGFLLGKEMKTTAGLAHELSEVDAMLSVLEQYAEGGDDMVLVGAISDIRCRISCRANPSQCNEAINWIVSVDFARQDAHTAIAKAREWSD
jgi:hypothetical protein